jgi:hypothetical protein
MLPWLAALASFCLGIFLASRPLGAVSVGLVVLLWHPAGIRNQRAIYSIFNKNNKWNWV